MKEIMSAKNIGILGSVGSSICLLGLSEQGALFLMLAGMSLILCGLGAIQGVMLNRACASEDALFCLLNCVLIIN